MTTDIKDLSQAKRLVTQLTARVAELEAKLSAQTAEPAYAHEYGRSNGDGSFSVEIVRGEVKPHHSPCKDWPIKPLYTHPAKTEQPSLSDAEISNLILEAESGMPYSPRLQAVPLTTVIALARRILAQRQDSDKDTVRKVASYAAESMQRACFNAAPESEAKICAIHASEIIDWAIANGAPK